MAQLADEPHGGYESESGQVDQMDIYGKGDVSSDETGPSVSSLASGIHAASAPAMDLPGNRDHVRN